MLYHVLQLIYKQTSLTAKLRITTRPAAFRHSLHPCGFEVPGKGHFVLTPRNLVEETKICE
jgi:hypothetical protein